MGTLVNVGLNVGGQLALTVGDVKEAVELSSTKVLGLWEHMSDS